MRKQAYLSIAVVTVTVFLIGCSKQEPDVYTIYGNYVLNEINFKVLRDSALSGVTFKRGTEVSYQPPLVSGELELSLSGRFSFIIIWGELIANLSDLSTISNHGTYIIDDNRIRLLGDNGEGWVYFDFMADTLTLKDTVDDYHVTYVFKK